MSRTIRLSVLSVLACVAAVALLVGVDPLDAAALARCYDWA